VHERGAPHVIDPSRLLASVSRLYSDMEERWGHPEPVPEGNVRVVGDGDTVLDRFRVAYTPGHASHHVAYLHERSGWAFVGDVAGVRIAPSDHTLMPTPPPDIDVEAWLDSIATVAAWEPAGLAITHFGGHEDVERVLADAREELQRWAGEARDAPDADAFLARFDADLDARVDDAALRATYRQASPPPLEYLGLERYWTKLGNARASA
jgi:glyoxylase-like metal-dependent hydrolase (beta-lactamase superfamily II)